MLLTVPQSSMFGIFFETVFQFRRARSRNSFWPHLDFARLVISFIETRHRAADASRAGTARPDDVVVSRIRRRKTAFAPRHRMPDAARELSTLATATAAKTAKLQAVARAAVRRTVLL